MKGLNKAKSLRRNVALEVAGRNPSPLNCHSNDDIASHHWGVKREVDLFPDNFLPTLETPLVDRSNGQCSVLRCNCH